MLEVVLEGIGIVDPEWAKALAEARPKVEYMRTYR